MPSQLSSRNPTAPRSSMDSQLARRSRPSRPAADVLHHILSSDEPITFLSPALERAASRSSSRRQSTMSISPARSFDSRNSSDSFNKADEGVAATALPSRQPLQSFSSSSSTSTTSSSASSIAASPSSDKTVRQTARSSTSDVPSDRGYSPLSAGFASLSRRSTVSDKSATRSASQPQSNDLNSSRALAAGMFGGPA